MIQTRRNLLLTAAGLSAAPLLMPLRASAESLGPASVATQPSTAKVPVASMEFRTRGEPTVTSQNVRQRARPGLGPPIPHWPSPGETRQVWLKRPQTGEELVSRYCSNGQLDMTEYLKVCRLLRDAQAGVAAYIDIEVLDLVFAMQRWLVSWGIDRPVVIQSGYRTAATNQRLEGAAKNSMHLRGKALDVRMEGVPVAYLGRLASIFAVGGVGFYVSKSFVHLDSGSVRTWIS